MQTISETEFVAVGDIWYVMVDGTEAGETVLISVAIVQEQHYRNQYVCIPLIFDGQYCESDLLLLSSEVETGGLGTAKVLANEEFTIERNHLQTKAGKLTAIGLSKILKMYVFNKSDHYFRMIHAPEQETAIVPGKSKINYAGRVFDQREIANLVDSSLDFWLTAGRYAGRFEQEFATFLGVKHCSLTNSGSSANLLAFMALTSPTLGEKRIKKGDEVITVAAAFPTSVTPIIQYGAIPVFVDITLPFYNIDCDKLEMALSDKTRAVMLAHTLGNPFDLQTVKDFCTRNDLWLIEDNCDALGARFLIDGDWRYTGTIGDLGTSSFYPAHHLTMGEGGAVYTNVAQLKRFVESFRDWGRDCCCPPGKDNTCGRRFSQQWGELPIGYDHKYVYSHFGYNLKVTEMQAAIGCAQMEKLPSFIAARRRNWNALREGLSDLDHSLILPEPTLKSDPCWFGFLLTVKDNAGFSRDEMVKQLESKGIQTRTLFAGNIVKHPCFDTMRREQYGYRIAGNLEVTDRVMNHSFWVGVYPGLTPEMIQFMIQEIRRIAGK